jgi:tetratricopeptide (TPR) repeat protein
MPRIEKTVFISYRRTNLPWALCIYQDLTSHGYDVFFDYLSINSGNFEKVILENIRTRAHFIIILTPSALEKCKNPDDWLRREIETAMEEKRNIVPLMLEGFDFGSPSVKEALIGKLASLSTFNGLPVPDAYALEAMDRLRERYLNIALSDVALPILKAEAREITDTQKEAANEAPPVREEQLTAQTWFERGYIFQNDKNIEEALRCYSEALRLDPNLNTAYNNLAVLLYDLKRYPEAEEAYRQAIAKDPNNAAAYSNLGSLLQKLERYPEAEEAYRQAIAKDPNLAQAYSNLGNLLMQLERYAEAEEAYRQAIAKDPNNAAAYYNLGILLKQLERYPEAEEAYRQAIANDPNDAAAYSNLGLLLHEKLERYAEAEEAYRQAIAKDPNLAQAYNNLAVMLRQIGREMDAIPILEKWMAVAPDDFNPFLGIASIQKRLGKPVSEEYLKRARALIPSEDWYNLACLESVGGNLEAAFEYLEKAAQKGKFNPNWAWKDPDLVWLQEEPRFAEIAGPKPEKG